MPIVWTKNWGPSDDGTILKGADLRNIQDDIDTTGTTDATKIHGFPIDSPIISNDGQALTYDDAGAKFTYSNLSGLPAGMGPIPYAGATAPAGWLLCTGQAVSRTTYASLFAIIGTAFGVGDGSTTFNVPDMRGRFPLGKDDMGGSSANRVTDAAADTVGGASGSETKDISHNHGGNTGTVVFGGGGTLTAGALDTSHYHPISTDGSVAQNVMNPFLTLNYIIKT